MASTRSTTGNSKPRVLPKIEEAAKKPVKAVKKTAKKATTTKANTSKPRAKKTTTGRVTKPGATKTKTATKAKPVAKPKTTTAKPAPKKAVVTKKTTASKVGGPRNGHAEPGHTPTLLDKAEGGILYVQGVITGSSGKKAAGTAKMRGTDGKKAGTTKAAS